jgi:hypothetical protein
LSLSVSNGLEAAAYSESQGARVIAMNFIDHVISHLAKVAIVEFIATEEFPTDLAI